MKTLPFYHSFNLSARDTFSAVGQALKKRRVHDDMNVIEAYLPEDHDDENLPEFKSNELKAKLDENVKTAEERMNNLYDQFAKREAELNAKNTELEKEANDTKEDNDSSGDDDTSDKEDANEEQSPESDNDSEGNEEAEVQSLESADESDEEPQCLESDDISVGDKEEDVVVLISDQSDTEGEHSSAANGCDPKEDLD